jgi:hypothetical protein
LLIIAIIASDIFAIATFSPTLMLMLMPLFQLFRFVFCHFDTLFHFHFADDAAFSFAFDMLSPRHFHAVISILISAFRQAFSLSSFSTFSSLRHYSSLIFTPHYASMRKARERAQMRALFVAARTTDV